MRGKIALLYIIQTSILHFGRAAVQQGRLPAPQEAGDHGDRHLQAKRTRPVEGPRAWLFHLNAPLAMLVGIGGFGIQGLVCFGLRERG